MPRIVTKTRKGRSGEGLRLSTVAIACAIVLAVAACLLLRPGKNAPITVAVDATKGKDAVSVGNHDAPSGDGGGVSQTAPAMHDKSEVRDNGGSRTNGEAAAAKTSAKPPKGYAGATPGSEFEENVEALVRERRESRIFTNEVENLLENLSRPGFQSVVAPHVDMSDDEAMAFLRKDVVVEESDDDAVVEAKERLAAMKTAALEYIEAGGTLNQFVRAVAAQSAEEEAAVRDVEREKSRLLETEGIDAARAYLRKMNPALRAAGLAEVEISLLEAIEYGEEDAP